MVNIIENHVKNKSKVISLEHGIGEIVGNFTMYDGIDDYLEVKYCLHDEVKLFCVKHSSDVRLISSKDDIVRALQLMAEKLCGARSKLSHNMMSVNFLDKDISFITKRIVDLRRKESMSERDRILLILSIESLVLEIEEVYQVDYKSAVGIVTESLKAA